MFFHHKNNTININNQVKLTLEQFKMLEPNYQDLPLGYDELFYEPEKHHYINGINRTSITKPLTWQDGDSYLDRIKDFTNLYNLINEKEHEITKKVNIELEKRKPYDEKRKKEYPDIEDMVVALWEHLIEKKTKKESGILELQKIRDSVKEKHIKPENNK